VREWSYTLTRHEPGRPWIIVAREHLTIELEDGVGVLRMGSAEVAERAVHGGAGAVRIPRMTFSVIVFAGSPPVYRKAVGQFGSANDATPWCEREGYTFQPNADEWVAVIPRLDESEAESPA
jgi:hypothetical protein